MSLIAGNEPVLDNDGGYAGTADAGGAAGGESNSTSPGSGSESRRAVASANTLGAAPRGTAR